jgi:hypothetical protein
MSDQPVHTFTSHIGGKNAKVEVYQDRIEWDLARGVSGAKMAAGIMTGGMSLLATGVKNGKAGTEMIPIKNISSVTTKRDGMLNTLVRVITSGNEIEFRVSHAEAKATKEVLTRLMLNPPSAPRHSAPTAAPAPSVVEQLQQLANLRDAGILTEAEFEAKKTEMLGRL